VNGFFSILQQLVILNSVFIVKFSVVVLVVYVASSLMNKDEYMRRHRKTLTYLLTYLPEPPRWQNQAPHSLLSQPILKVLDFKLRLSGHFYNSVKFINFNSF